MNERCDLLHADGKHPIGARAPPDNLMLSKQFNRQFNTSNLTLTYESFVNMNINSVFPCRFFKASDIGDQNATEIIERVVIEDVGRNNEADETRPVVYFSGQ